VSAAAAERGRALLIALKSVSGAPGPVLTLPVPVASGADARLRPVSVEPGRLDAGDVRALTEWRNRHVGAFLHEFPATEARTARWLSEEVRGDDTRILFMVDNAQGEPIGYMGLAYIDWAAGWGELDALVRGGTASPVTMMRATRTLLDWGRGQLGLDRIGARMRSDNAALRYLLKIGWFVERRRVALRRAEGPDGTQWHEDPSGTSEPMLVHIELADES
jgi:RimJ/RimL family protein N-acetyltransferase